MKFSILLFIPFLATAQIDLPTKNACPETSFTFFRQGQQEQQFTKTYDAQGKILKQTNTFSSRNTGNYSEEYTYSYDEKGNNNVIVYKRNNIIIKTTKKEFDANGKVSKESINSNLNLISSNTSNGNENIQIFYDQDGKIETLREITTQNTNGQILKKVVKNPSGKVLVSDTKTYNIQGKITQDIHFDATDNVTTQTDFEYSKEGNLLTDKTLRNNIVFAETKNEFDATGKMTKKTRLNGKGLVDYYFMYEYDAQGNLLKENYFYNNQIVSVRAYEYDAKGNKIKEQFLDKAGNISAYKIWKFACK